MPKKKPSGQSAKPSSREKLPDAELEVLACLWQRGEATAREVREEMAPYRPMAHGSTVTLLTRLEKRGLVTKRKGNVGKSFVYNAACGPDPFYRRIMANLHAYVFGGNGVAMVTSLFETRPPTPDELEELQSLLNKLRKDQNTRGNQS